MKKIILNMKFSTITLSIIVAVGATLFALIAATGCSRSGSSKNSEVSMAGLNAGRTWTFDEIMPPGTPTIRTRFNVGKNFYRYGPMIADGMLVATNDDTLKAMNIESGELLWSVILPDGGGIYGSPTLAEGKVFFGMLKGNQFYARNLQDGSVAWQFDIPDSNLTVHDSATLYADGVFYAVANDRKSWPRRCRIYAISAEDGSELWHHDDESYGIRLALGSGVIVFTGSWRDDYFARALDAKTGETLWDKNDRIESQPVVIGDAVYYGYYGAEGSGEDWNIAASDLRTGEVRWSQSLSPKWNESVGPIGRTSALYMVHPKGQVLRLDPSTGETLETKTLDKVHEFVLDGADNIFYRFSTRRTQAMIGLSATDGSQMFNIGERKADYFIRGPILYHGRLYGLVKTKDKVIQLVGYGWD